jgi:magnesium-transporting ATPase (P-type)
MRVNSSSINEELGAVEQLLTDKTGTLTQNIMKFYGACVGGKTVGDAPGEVARAADAADAADAAPAGGPQVIMPARHPRCVNYDSSARARCCSWSSSRRRRPPSTTSSSRSPPATPGSAARARGLGLYPIVTLEKQLPNMIGNLV